MLGKKNNKSDTSCEGLAPGGRLWKLPEGKSRGFPDQLKMFWTIALKDKKKVYITIEILLQIIDIINVTAKDVRKAFHPDASDFEDELITVCAERAKMDYIVTRNTWFLTRSYRW